MTFTNKINKDALKDALINWSLGTDGNDGATEYVMDEIPWTEEMGFDYWDDVVYEKIDNAIGSRCDDGGECWEVSKLVQDLNYHGQRFLKFIDKKVEDIYNTYQKCIDGAEKYREKKNAHKHYWWKMEGISVVVESKKFFNTHEECYEDMRKSVNDKVLWNIGFDDFKFDESPITIKITATRNKIVCESHSGTYTWTVEKV